jgi:protein-disulfide isomerase
MRRTAFILIGVLALAVFAAGIWTLFLPKADSATRPAEPGFSLTAYDRTLGQSSAPVTLIEYAAPICPHCAAFDMESFPDLKTAYIDSGKVFYVFRVYPLRPDDGPAEKLARCLPKERYFSFIDLLFRRQPEWDGAEYPVADDHAGLVRIARIAGMSAEEAEHCMTDTATDAAINRIAEEGARRYAISGTPTFVVNGQPGPAGELWPQLRQRLDAALAMKPR